MLHIGIQVHSATGDLLNVFNDSKYELHWSLDFIVPLINMSATENVGLQAADVVFTTRNKA